jgi:hypothetical protein
MSESLRVSCELSPNEAIARAIHYWLAEEIQSSGSSKNAVLDNFYTARKSFMLRADDQGNKNIGKNDGHYNRLKLWTSQFEENSTDDYLTARQLFCAQMYLSGMFRLECFVVSNDEAEYRFRRFGGQVLGVDLRKSIAGRFSESNTVELSRLADATNAANDQTYFTLRTLHDRNRRSDTLFNYVRFLNTRGDWFKELSSLQNTWLDLSVDYISYAAQARGKDLSKVPFLEPKSISENPQIYYPFKVTS